MDTVIRCTGCRRPYPREGLPYRCHACGGVYDFDDLPNFDPGQVDREMPGLWRYRHAFSLPPEAPVVYLGEADTPLVWAQVFDWQVAFKLEFLNPTGSFKDRGTALMVSWLLARGVEEAVEDSSGNAGSSFAAYAAVMGIRARIYVPDYAAGPKRVQIAAYGAEVVQVPGPRSNAAEAVVAAADQGAVYASHAHLPQGLPGFASIAYELVEQLGTQPGTVIAPVGQGSLLLGVGRGFDALQRAGSISQMPVLVGVQAAACAPLWAVFTYGPAGLNRVTEGETLAEGVRIRYPLRGDALLEMVASSQGRFVIVEEPAILAGQGELARLGLFVEPTSAIVWEALSQVIDQVPEPIVLILTGSGLKSA
jgi:threonine synthase